VAAVLVLALPLRSVADVGDERAARVAQLRVRGFDAAYNLDYPEAVALFDQAIALDPDDSATHRARAVTEWLHIIFRRGDVTVDQYMGSMTRSDLTIEKPPAQEVATFTGHSTQALELAERRLSARPKDVQALYDAGAAVGLIASYAATVDGRVAGAFRYARRAFNAHEQVLALDPSRHEAGLVVGTYRYLVSTLALPMRWMAYVVGFGGDRSKGLQLIEAAAGHPSDAQTDALFALMLLYNREGRFADAMAVIHDLMTRYPRNRLLSLEAGATAIRARQYSNADRLLSDGISRLSQDPRPRAFGEEALWFYKRGLARLSLRRLDSADVDLQAALARPSRDWVQARIHLEIGKLADLRGQRVAARAAYAKAIRLANSGNDMPTRAEAERWDATPYR
jgi:tetratricopeptide (TPR) repeat protein